RGRRAAELVATVWPVHRTAAPAPGREPAAQALSLRLAHLSGARVLGCPIGKPVQRGDFVGKICASGRGRKIRRSIRRRHGWSAAHRGSGIRALGQGQEKHPSQKGKESGGEEIVAASERSTARVNYRLACGPE